MFFAIFCGFPVAFVMGGLALVFAVLGWMLDIFPMLQISNIVLRMWGNVAIDPILVSIPMFMGSILERSGSAKDMLGAMEVMLKRVPARLRWRSWRWAQSSRRRWAWSGRRWSRR